MDISIIIVNFNSEALIKECVSSIEKHSSGFEFEIIIVDNSYKKGAEKIFTSFSNRIRYVKSELNLGFGAANNLGFKKATGRYFLVLNADTLFIENSILECIKFFDSTKDLKAGVIGVKLLNEDGSFQPSFYPFLKHNLVRLLLTSNPLIYRLFSAEKYYKEKNKVTRVLDISGAFMFMKKEVYQKVGGFDPEFFIYYEESEWCHLRISKYYNIYFVPQTQVIHYGGGTSNNSNLHIQKKLSSLLYWRKKGVLNYIGYLVIEFINITTKLVLALFSRNYLIEAKKDLSVSIALLNFMVFKLPFLYYKRNTPLAYPKLISDS
ncbi:MAG: glycosyltransferase family 2 protein [Bacteroidota bacterium]